MHLGNGAITPECAILTASIAAAGLGFAAANARRTPVARDAWLTVGACGGAIFAAQMINVPLLPYSSGHLVGGVLLAVVLGPGLGALTMAIVLALQALLLGDGGLTALGANVINMALLPAVVVAAGKRWQGENGSAFHAGMQAALAVLLAAALIVVEVSIARPVLGEIPLASFAGQMLFAHAIIALAEGLLTGALVYALRYRSVHKRSEMHLTTTACATALLLLMLVPLSSPLPDGYEAAINRSGWSALLAETGDIAQWQEYASASVADAFHGEWALALVATITTGALCATFAWMSSRGRMT